MNNIYKRKLEELKKKKEKGFMPFSVIGDPDFKTSLEVVKAMIKGGADFLELGIPFSDPTADGPTIQLADQRALKAGMNTDKVFEFISEVRKFTNVPIGVLVYYNIIMQYGEDGFYKKAGKVGIDSVLVADMPPEEAKNMVQLAKKNNVKPIFIVSRLTTENR